MILSDVYKEFILQKRLAGLSDATITDYENIISIFIDYVGSSLRVDKLTYKCVSGFILDLYGRSLSKSTVATYIRNMSIFLMWVYKEYDLSFNPDKIKVPKSPKKLVHIYTDDELNMFFHNDEVK